MWRSRWIRRLPRALLAPAPASIVVLAALLFATTFPGLSVADPLPEAEVPDPPAYQIALNPGPQPFPPTGHFETSFVPGGNIHVSENGVLFVYGRTGLFRSDDGGHMWQPVGDPSRWSDGRALALSPAFSEDHTVFAGVAFGDSRLVLSTDGGWTWSDPAQPVTGQVISIAASPAFRTDRTVYASTDEYPVSRLLRSNDGGQHWQAVNRPPGDSAVEEIVLSPYYATDHRLYVRLRNQTLWCSRDSASTWQPADNGLPSGSGWYVQDLDIAALGSGEVALFAATSLALIISFDDGQTWYLIDLVRFEEIAIPLDFASSLVIMGIGSGLQLWRSVDLGASWTQAPMPGYVRYLAVATNWRKPAGAYAYGYGTEGRRFWVSNDEGATWTSTSWCPVIRTSSNDGFNVALSPAYEQDRFLLAWPDHSDGVDQLFRSCDGGRTWSETRLPAAAGYKLHMAISRQFAADRTVVAAVDDQLFISQDRGAHWSPLGNPLPFATSALQLSPNFAADQTLFVAGYGSGVFRSTNAGQSWDLVSASLEPYIYDLDLSPGYPGDPTLYATTHYGGLMRSSDGGDNWEALHAPCASRLLSLSPAFVQDNTLFGIPGPCRSNDRGDNWSSMNFDAPYIESIAASPRYDQDQTVIVGTDRDMWISEDAGTTSFSVLGRQAVGAGGYEDGRLMLFAGTPDAVYRYHWPSFSARPARVGVALQPGSMDPMSSQITLTMDDRGEARWEITEEADWLSISPVTGTLPATVTLIVDPTLLGASSASTEVSVRVYWSLRQMEVHRVPVTAFVAEHQVYLPLGLRRHAAGTPTASVEGQRPAELAGSESRLSALERLRPFTPEQAP